MMVNQVKPLTFLRLVDVTVSLECSYFGAALVGTRLRLQSAQLGCTVRRGYEGFMVRHVRRAGCSCLGARFRSGRSVNVTGPLGPRWLTWRGLSPRAQHARAGGGAGCHCPAPRAASKRACASWTCSRVSTSSTASCATHHCARTRAGSLYMLHSGPVEPPGSLQAGSDQPGSRQPISSTGPAMEGEAGGPSSRVRVRGREWRPSHLVLRLPAAQCASHMPCSRSLSDKLRAHEQESGETTLAPCARRCAGRTSPVAPGERLFTIYCTSSCLSMPHSALKPVWGLRSAHRLRQGRDAAESRLRRVTSTKRRKVHED